MNLYIDTEFNGFGGELISMALVSKDGKEFYQCLSITNSIDPWVRDNVIPVLGIKPIDHMEFNGALASFLKNWSEVTVIADWPEDIKYFCDELIVGPGAMVNIGPVIDIKIDRRLNSNASKIPHNALEDARAIMEMVNKKELK